MGSLTGRASSRTPRTVAVLGGGHGGHTLAADLTLAGHTVRFFEMERFRHQMAKVFETHTIEAVGEVLKGTAHIDLVTTDIAAALDGAEIILIAVPAFAHKDYAQLLAPHVRAGQIVTLLPGTLGSLEFARIFREAGSAEGVVLAEADTLPYATRVEGEGVVRVYGRSTVGMGVFPASKTQWATEVLSDVLDLEAGKNVLEIGFSSINPVIHPPGTVLNAGRIERSKGEFYVYEEGMTPSVARVIDCLDAERLAVAEALGMTLLPVAEALSSAGLGPKGSTWQTLNGSQTLTFIKGPTSLKSRYLAEDIPYGLLTWASIADGLGVDTPIMDAFVSLGFALLGYGPERGSRSAAELGLAGLGVDAMLDYVQEGRAPLTRASTVPVVGLE
jgi:opine dehydrogenase